MDDAAREVLRELGIPLADYSTASQYTYGDIDEGEGVEIKEEEAGASDVDNGGKSYIKKED